ncbi:FAD:protein FMN transferase [Chitinophagales bacterium]|nr:FAD:protein FMN transferase [Chitinophagales bacterium]
MILLIALLFQLPSYGLAQSTEAIAQKKALLLMGCSFELTAVAVNKQQSWDAINAGIGEIERIEALISSWDPNSQTSAINDNAGIKEVAVDDELFQLIYRAKKISKLTEGAFDITYASMDKIWRFDGTMTEAPSIDEIADSRSKIDWEKIILDNAERTVFLPETGMKIGFGAIGKGYAANKAKELMKDMPGVIGGLVNASGDLISWGENTKKKGWTISISDPKNKQQPLAWLQIDELSVVTSGDYEKFALIDGIRYAHIIDPRTGYPTTGIKSVTIICPDAELGDALATSVFVLGASKGLALINKLEQVECIIVTDTDELVASSNLNLNYF